MTKQNSPGFEEQLARLQEIAVKLEQGGLSLEDSLKIYKEGVDLSAECRKLLNEARHLVRIYAGDGLKDFAESDRAAGDNDEGF